MTEKIEPMTAAEYRRTFVANSPLTRRILAALEDREANLAHARLGSLVRRIGELQPSAYLTWAGHPMCYYVKHPSVLQSALDSLLPKEPEVVTGPSGSKYRWDSGRVEVLFDGGMWRPASDFYIPITDAPVVAALLARQEGKGNG